MQRLYPTYAIYDSLKICDLEPDKFTCHSSVTSTYWAQTKKKKNEELLITLNTPSPLHKKRKPLPPVPNTDLSKQTAQVM